MDNRKRTFGSRKRTCGAQQQQQQQRKTTTLATEMENKRPKPLRGVVRTHLWSTTTMTTTTTTTTTSEAR